MLPKAIKEERPPDLSEKIRSKICPLIAIVLACAGTAIIFHDIGRIKADICWKGKLKKLAKELQGTQVKQTEQKIHDSLDLFGTYLKAFQAAGNEIQRRYR